MPLPASRIARNEVLNCPRRETFFLLASAILLFLTCPAIRAQQPSPAPDSQKPQASDQTTAAKTEPSPPVALFDLLNRKSIVFPDIAANAQPLTKVQKFQLFVDNSISLHAVTGAAFGAGLAQAVDTPHGFGQGGDAYAKRFGSSMARLASSNFFGTFVIASALHQDPRFFPRREPTFARSVKYSLERVVITRNDEGKDVKNWSGLLGPLLSEGLANAYWPDQDRTAGQTFQRYGIDLAVRAGANLLREYWPMIARKVPGIRQTTGGNP
jgi:hypothetical protein